MSVRAKASRVKMLLFDVDGVLTDGKILLHPDGSESKQFDIKDGTGLVSAQRAGLKVGILSARTSAVTTRRAQQLGISIVHQGTANKLRAYREILQQHSLTDAQVAYMGDDVLDIPIVECAGLSACPCDAVAEIRSRVDYISRAKGGRGAARELVELVLKAQGHWKKLLASYRDHESGVARSTDVVEAPTPPRAGSRRNR